MLIKFFLCNILKYAIIYFNNIPTNIKKISMPIETITNHVNQINYNTLTNIDNDNHNTSHNFSNYIDNLLNSINLTQNNAKKNSQEFILEKPGVSLSDIMIDLQKSSISINMAVQIRNKVISAYQEIMNMQV